MSKTAVGSLIVLMSFGLLYSCAGVPYPEEFGFTGRTTVPAHTEDVMDMDLSADGKYLASAGMDRRVRVWDTDSFEELGASEEHPEDIVSVAISLRAGEDHTGMIATGSRDGVVRIYGLPEGKRLHLLRGHAENVNSVAFTPDGGMLLSGSKDGSVRVWDPEEGKQLHLFQGHSEEVHTVTTAPGGERAYSAGGDGTLREWFLEEDFAPGFAEKINKFRVLTVRVSRDGEKIAYTGMDNIYDSAEKEWRRTYPVYFADLTDDGPKNQEMRDGHSHYIWGLAWSPEGKTVVSGGNDQQIYFWDAENEYTFQRLRSPSGRIWDIEYSPDGRRVFLATEDGDIVVYSRE